MGYVFILTDFKKVVFSCFIPDISQCVNSYFETGKVEFFNKFISETFCVLGKVMVLARGGYSL